jgi:hypothetical protein
MDCRRTRGDAGASVWFGDHLGRVPDAISSWKAAERAYRKELDRYISVGWGTDPRHFIEAEVMTHDVLERLRALREAIDVAQAHYELVCAEIP